MNRCIHAYHHCHLDIHCSRPAGWVCSRGRGALVDIEPETDCAACPDYLEWDGTLDLDAAIRLLGEMLKQDYGQFRTRLLKRLEDRPQNYSEIPPSQPETDWLSDLGVQPRTHDA